MKYQLFWRDSNLKSGAKSVEEMILALRNTADELEKINKEGLNLILMECTGDYYAYFGTNDPILAEKFNMDKVEDSE